MPGKTSYDSNEKDVKKQPMRRVTFYCPVSLYEALYKIELRDTFEIRANEYVPIGERLRRALRAFVNERMGHDSQ